MPRVVHVIDADLARGAQRAGRMLVDGLDGRHGLTHRLITIFDGPQVVLDPHERLAAARFGRKSGLAPAAVHACRTSSAIATADLLVAHGGEALKYLTLARVTPPIVYHKIGLLGRRAERVTNARLHRWSVDRAAHVVAISRQVAAEASTALGVARPRLTVIGNARDPETFRPARTPRPTSSRPGPTRLLWVGNLSRTKRPDRFVNAVGRVADDGLRVEASVVGGGPLLSELRSSVSNVRFLGAIDDVASAYRDHDVFVFTSIPEGEGMPGVLIEAAMSGLPIVTTDVPGARDVVVDDVSGIVVEADDDHAADDAIRRMVASPETRWSMGEAARAHATENFSPEAVLEAWTSTCLDIVANTREVLCTSSM